jgi:hypothetical protein
MATLTQDSFAPVAGDARFFLRNAILMTAIDGSPLIRD